MDYVDTRIPPGVSNGTRMRVAGRDVVRGDLIVLSEGDRVAADAVGQPLSELYTYRWLSPADEAAALAGLRERGAAVAQEMFPAPGGILLRRPFHQLQRAFGHGHQHRM